MVNVGTSWVFHVDGGVALLDVVTFLGVLRHFHGPRALPEW